MCIIFLVMKQAKHLERAFLLLIDSNECQLNKGWMRTTLRARQAAEITSEGMFVCLERHSSDEDSLDMLHRGKS